MKAPKAATHTAKLVNTGAVLAEFFAQIAALGEKLGPVLFQLPPKLAFDDGDGARVSSRPCGSYIQGLCSAGGLGTKAGLRRLSRECLREYEVARVAADPPKGSALAAKPAGWDGLRYYRWHGAPRTYWSEYSAERLTELAAEIRKAKSAETWVIFDNTAMGHALHNAVELKKALA